MQTKTYDSSRSSEAHSISELPQENPQKSNKFHKALTGTLVVAAVAIGIIYRHQIYAFLRGKDYSPFEDGTQVSVKICGMNSCTKNILPLLKKTLVEDVPSFQDQLCDEIDYLAVLSSLNEKTVENLPFSICEKLPDYTTLKDLQKGLITHLQKLEASQKIPKLSDPPPQVTVFITESKNHEFISKSLVHTDRIEGFGSVASISSKIAEVLEIVTKHAQSW